MLEGEVGGEKEGVVPDGGSCEALVAMECF